MRHLLIDGNHLSGRCNATMKDMYTSDGHASGVLLGFLNGLSYARKQMRVDWKHVIICWDGGHSKVRKTLYPEYKGNRKKADQSDFEKTAKEDYYTQLNILYQELGHLGLSQMRVLGVEADDLIGIYSQKVEEAGCEVMIYSGDYDMHQLVSDRISIYHPGKKGMKTVLGKKEVEDLWGCTVAQIPLFKAITGDNSDNIPGVPQVGAVRAKMVLPYIDMIDGDLSITMPEDAKAEKWVSEVWKYQNLVVRNVALMELPRYWNESYYTEREHLTAEAQLADVRESNLAKFINFLRTWELNSILDSINRW